MNKNNEEKELYDFSINKDENRKLYWYCTKCKKMFSNRFKNSYLKSYAEKSFYEQHFVCNEESHKPFWKKMYI